MTIWEKVVVNLEKGARKFAVAAATFSERVKAEIQIVRLRIRVDELRSRIDELYRVIGRKLVELKKKEALPRTGDLVLKDEDISAALLELAEREKELEDLFADIKHEQSAFKPDPGHTEDGNR